MGMQRFFSNGNDPSEEIFFFLEWKRNGERNAFWNGMAMEKLNVLGMGIRM